MSQPCSDIWSSNLPASSWVLPGVPRTNAVPTYARVEDQLGSKQLQGAHDLVRIGDNRLTAAKSQKGNVP